MKNLPIIELERAAKFFKNDDNIAHQVARGIRDAMSLDIILLKAALLSKNPESIKQWGIKIISEANFCAPRVTAAAKLLLENLDHTSENTAEKNVLFKNLSKEIEVFIEAFNKMDKRYRLIRKVFGNNYSVHDIKVHEKRENFNAD